MPTSQTVQSDKSSTGQREYRWDASQRLRQIVSNSGTANFNHDDFGNLAWVQYENGVHDYRLQDKVGNIYKTPGKKDRKYEPGGKVIESDKARFQYDPEGNLIRKISGGETWGYEWYSNGMLKSVVRPDGKVITFRYDALGRRIEKEFNGQLTRFIWDGNVPLHEWSYPLKDRPVTEVDELGNVQQNHAEPVPEKTLVTWIFEEGTYVPVAKLVNGKRYSIVTDHLGTPYEAYDETGEKIWQCELDIYGKVRKLAGDKTLVPFRYQGQYEDIETGLYYNRFRYYSPEEGIYISQDPVKLWGGNKLYAYVHDPNIYCDVLGLTGIPFGFNSFGQFKQFGEATQGSLTKAGYPNATPYMQGSAVTGRSFETKVPFDVGRTSDFDLAIAHSDLYKKAESLGLGKDGRTGPIKMGSAEAKQLGVDDMLQKLSRMSGGREVNTMIFKDAEAAKAKAPSIRLPTKCH
jgi:RHS repeat-associated protein